jgi:lipoprotein-releasing system ATP-binding protein
MKLIELKSINKSYFSPEETKVLHSIDLSINSEEMVAIVGQSGSGKSTLMNIMGTLDKPTSGEVLINGEETTRMSNKEISRFRNETIGFVFQFHYLLPEYTVLENVMMPEFIKGKKASAEAVKRAKELIELVGLSERMNSLSTNISGGQQQRTAIARALMNKPKLILADEPTGNLDSDTSAKIYQLFCQINRELETAFVVITHDDRIAAKTDRIVEIKDGKIIKDVPNQKISC